MEDVKRAFSIRLVALRKSRRYSQAALAEVLGVGRTTLSGYETGSFLPDSETLLKMVDLFECSADYILGREKVKVPGPNSRLEQEVQSLYDSFISVPELVDSSFCADLKALVDNLSDDMQFIWGDLHTFIGLIAQFDELVTNMRMCRSQKIDGVEMARCRLRCMELLHSMSANLYTHYENSASGK